MVIRLMPSYDSDVGGRDLTLEMCVVSVTFVGCWTEPTFVDVRRYDGNSADDDDDDDLPFTNPCVNECAHELYSRTCRLWSTHSGRGNSFQEYKYDRLCHCEVRAEVAETVEHTAYNTDSNRPVLGTNLWVSVRIKKREMKEVVE